MSFRVHLHVPLLLANGDRIDPAGLDLRPLLADGWLYIHAAQDMGRIIGYVDAATVDGDELLVEGVLIDTDAARPLLEAGAMFAAVTGDPDHPIHVDGELDGVARRGASGPRVVATDAIVVRPRSH